MKRLFSKRVVLAIAVVVVILFLLRPGASHLKTRITASMSAALGRPVEIGTVHFRILPQPGFDLENLTVYDDPAFGAEPLLRASEVTANLRFTSLLHGRLEISRLDLTEPSLNLVHEPSGHWNIESLLRRSAQSSLAPTAKSSAEPRPEFPYIEASSARINLKSGQEKKPYALTNADFTLWQDTENSWGVRLKAQPMRTDINISDPGTLRVEGQWQRAASLRDTPLNFTLEWDRPQLGQLTKLITGDDRGWRGTVLLDATLTGSPSRLQISTDASIRDFRRYDISTGSALRLNAHCEGQYTSADHSFHQLFCRAPVGDGALTLHGDVALLGQHKYDLVAMAQDVPAAAMVALAQHVKGGMSPDLTATGDLQGTLSLSALPGEPAKVLGTGNIATLHLVNGRDNLNLDSVPFVMTASDTKADRRVKISSSVPGSAASPFVVEIGPFPIPVGRSAAPIVSATLRLAGYQISLAGEADIARTLRLAHAIGIPALNAAVDGLAQVNLQVTGNWFLPNPEGSSSAAPALASGNVKLHNVRAELRGVDGPVEILNASIDLQAGQVRVSKVSAMAAHTAWSGSLDLPRGCGTPAACTLHFNLAAGEAGLAEITNWVDPKPKARPWYKLLAPSSSSQPAFLNTVRASGRLTIGHLQLHQLTATHVSANIDLNAGKLHISHTSADLLGGSYTGELQADLLAKPPVYQSSGILTQISLARLAGWMKDEWIDGTASGSFRVKGVGSTTSDFWQSADGTIQFEMYEGSLPHLFLVGETPLSVQRFAGAAQLQQGKIEFENTVLSSPSGTFMLSGSANLNRQLNLKLSRSPMIHPSLTGTRAYTITGTLSQPHVTALTALEAEAQLEGKN